MDLAEVGIGDVRVDLGGGDVSVSEHGLDGAKVGAVHEKVGGERMAEGVGGDVFSNAGEAGVFFDDAGDGTRSDAAVITGGVGIAGIATVVEEERRERISAGIEVVGNAVGGGLADENWAVLAAFAAYHKFATFEVD